MALTASEFLFPAGDLREDMLPGDDLDSAVAVWIADAEAKTEDEEAQAAWVYHRAYTAVYLRLNTIASSSSVSEKGSLAYSREQIEGFGTLAATYRSAYLDAVREPAASFAVVRSLR